MNRPNPSLDCVDFKVLLSPYLDGELAVAQRFEADRHLIECKTCRELLERAEASDETIRALCANDPSYRSRIGGEIALPSDFESNVLHRVRRRRTMQWTRVSGSLGLLAAAAAIALTAVVWYVGLRGGRVDSNNSSGNFVRDTPGAGTEWESLGPGVYGPPPPVIRPRDTARSAPSLNGDEAQSVHGTATILQAMLTTPFEDVAARERLRQIAIYDELLIKLAEVDPKLDALDRRHLAAARATLIELLRGTSDLTSWNAMQEDMRAFDLPGALEEISTSADSRIGV